MTAIKAKQITNSAGGDQEKILVLQKDAVTTKHEEEFTASSTHAATKAG